MFVFKPDSDITFSLLATFFWLNLLTNNGACHPPKVLLAWRSLTASFCSGLDAIFTLVGTTCPWHLRGADWCTISDLSVVFERPLCNECGLSLCPFLLCLFLNAVNLEAKPMQIVQKVMTWGSSGGWGPVVFLWKKLSFLLCLLDKVWSSAPSLLAALVRLPVWRYSCGAFFLL